MANYTQIRAGAATPAIGDLQEFQLGYCTGDGLLYIGVPQSGNIVPLVVGSKMSTVINASSTDETAATSKAVYGYAFAKAGGTITGPPVISNTFMTMRRNNGDVNLLMERRDETTDAIVKQGNIFLSKDGFQLRMTDAPSGNNWTSMIIREPVSKSSIDHAVELWRRVNGVDSWYRMYHSGMTTPIPIAQGGTGRTDGKVAALATPRQINGVNFDGTSNITITANPNAHNHSASNITSGTLDTARGGTGQTSLQATRNAMGLGNTTGALPIANGGTGATNVANAVSALGLTNALVVSASGNSGNHQYMRFTNGLQVCYGTHSWSSQTTTALGNIYLTNTYGSFSFPVAFTSVISATATKRGSVSNSGLYRMAHSNTGLSHITMFRGNSNSTNALQEVDYFVIGRWE